MTRHIAASMTSPLFATLFAVLTAAVTLPAGAADLSISIEGVASADGQLMVALYNSADTFRGKPYRAVCVPAAAGTVTVEIKDLAPADYAFALYHDANQNKKLDTNLVGMPVEDYAFSNNAMGQRSAPSYDAARFALPAGGAAVKVTLR
jgi:uncharacterized protein (DUF2141 family)